MAQKLVPRSEGSLSEHHVVLGPTRIDLGSGSGRGPRGDFSLSANESALLGCLAARSGEVVSRDELQVRALGYSPVSLTRAVDAAISRIRAKIEPDPANPTYLQTIYGVGYRLVHDAPAPAARARLDPLHGRDAELDRAAATLRSSSMAQLVGPPGVGKTHLALALAARERSARVALAPGEEAGAALLRQLGAGAGEGSLRLAAARLVGTLVVLDAEDPPPDAEAVGEAELVGGNPLALGWFARRSAVVDVDELVRRLPEGDGGVGGDLPARTLAWAWSVLDAAERETVLELLQFRGPFSLEGAAAVLGGRDVPSTLARLGDLVARGVLVRRDPRFEVYPLLRLAAASEARAGDSPARVRWRGWMSAEVAELAGRAPTIDVMERVRAERADLRSFLDGALAEGDRAAVEDAAWVLARSAERSEPPAALLGLLDRVIEAAPDAPVLRVSRANGRHGSSTSASGGPSPRPWSGSSGRRSTRGRTRGGRPARPARSPSCCG